MHTTISLPQPSSPDNESFFTTLTPFLLVDPEVWPFPLLPLPLPVPVPEIIALPSPHVPAAGKHVAQNMHCASDTGKRSWIMVVRGSATREGKRTA